MQAWMAFFCWVPTLVPMTTLTLEDALKHAIASDARFELSRMDEQIADQKFGESLGQAIPSLRLGATLTRNAKEIQVGEGTSARIVSPLYQPQGNASARAILFRGPQIPELLAVRYEADATHEAQAEQQDELLHEIAALYLELAEAQAGMAVRDKALEVANELLALTTARTNLGMGVPSEVVQARAEQARALAEQKAAIGALNERANWLYFRLGLSPETALALQCDRCIPMPADEDMLDLKARTDLAAFAQMAKAAEIRSLGSWLGFLPEIEAVGNLRLSEPTLFNPEVVWWNAQVVASWEIFSGTRDLARHIRYNIEERRAKEASRLAHEEANVGVRQAKLNWETREAERRAAEAALEAAQSGFSRAKIRFQEGAASFFEVTEMARRQTDAEQSSIHADFAVQHAALRLRRALGLSPVELP